MSTPEPRLVVSVDTDDLVSMSRKLQQAHALLLDCKDHLPQVRTAARLLLQAWSQAVSDRKSVV